MCSPFPALGLLALLLTALVAVSAEFDELCVGQAQNSFVAHPDSCQKYVLCQNGRGIVDLCPQANKETWFDPIRRACATPGPFCTPPPCTGNDRVFVADTTTGCGSWHFCLDGEISHSMTCPDGLSFVPESQFCTYPLCADATAPARSSPHIVL